MRNTFKERYQVTVRAKETHRGAVVANALALRKARALSEDHGLILGSVPACP